MPRNGAGVFSLLYPVLVGKLRSSTEANENFEDIGNEITNSLPINGQAAMTGQFKAANGAIMFPGIAFASDRDLGFRRRGVDAMSWVSGGQDRFYIDQNGKAWFLGDVDAAGNVTIQNGLSGGDLAAIDELDGTGVPRRTGANEWELDEGRVMLSFDCDWNGGVIDPGDIWDVRIPFNGRIEAISIVGDQEGWAVLDIWKTSFANYPPTQADSICGGNKPTIDGLTLLEFDPDGWDINISAGDCLRFHLEHVWNFRRLTITLGVDRFF